MSYPTFEDPNSLKDVPTQVYPCKSMIHNNNHSVVSMTFRKKKKRGLVTYCPHVLNKIKISYNRAHKTWTNNAIHHVSVHAPNFRPIRTILTTGLNTSGKIYAKILDNYKGGEESTKQCI